MLSNVGVDGATVSTKKGVLRYAPTFPDRSVMEMERSEGPWLMVFVTGYVMA